MNSNGEFFEELTEEQEMLLSIKDEFKKFLKNYNVNMSHGELLNNNFCDEILDQHYKGTYYLIIDMAQITDFSEFLGQAILKYPIKCSQMFDKVTTDLCRSLVSSSNISNYSIPTFQVMLTDYTQDATTIADVKNNKNLMNKYVKIKGTVISISLVSAKSTTMDVKCKQCQKIRNINVKPGLEQSKIHTKCNQNINSFMKCKSTFFELLPPRHCINYQLLKISEQSDISHDMTVYIERSMCNKVSTGETIEVYGKLCTKPTFKDSFSTGEYVLASSLTKLDAGLYNSPLVNINADEHWCIKLSRHVDLYDILVNSISPTIVGCDDIKKALCCLLFGGTCKLSRNGLSKHGTINVLLVGDPGMAKSQFLKFVKDASPVGIFTSGKGASSVGLTASVNYSSTLKTFILEPGLMVLADGGVACIDEFEKMDDKDRQAINDAMENHTVTICKAGMMSTLNSRCSVLAAANSKFGRWNDCYGADNIDLQPATLTRFDMIFVLKDNVNDDADTQLTRQVIKQFHRHCSARRNHCVTTDKKHLSLTELKKYIMFCKKKCAPRLTPSAKDELFRHYTVLRGRVDHDVNFNLSMPITLRQLESTIRISESIARMHLKDAVTIGHVTEALRLFNMSTLATFKIV